MKRYVLQMIAAFMIISMSVADASMYLKYVALDERQLTGHDQYVVEEHEIETAMADGDFGAENTDGENPEDGNVELSEGKSLFNILEIYPTEKKALIGYLISGCEPVVKRDGSKVKPIRDPSTNNIIVSEAQLREAYMDALVNKAPGTNEANRTNNSPQLVRDIVWNFTSKLAECGFSDALVFDANGNTFRGCYKYVGKDMGVFAEGGKNSDGDKIMYSRFYDYDPSKDYGYIFVYNSEPTGDKDIAVSNHKRIKYTNNDRFIRDYIGKTDDESVKNWKDAHVVEITTRTPVSVTLEDIERADLILVNNGNNMNSYTYALEMYNQMTGAANINQDNDLMFSADLDFNDFVDSSGVSRPGFEKVLRIYERVAIRKDVAFSASVNAYRPNWNNRKVIDTNMRKLMCMLFFVVKRDDMRPGAGREFFQDFIKRYTSEPGNYLADGGKKGPNDSGKKTYWDLRTENEKYIAPSLRDKPYPFMHYHFDWLETHPGHPLTTNIDNAVSGGHFEDGILVKENDHDKIFRRTIRRQHESYYKNAGIAKKSNDNPDGYYYSQQRTAVGDELVQDSQAFDHPWCLDGYESMSNTTDYTYIDDDGTLVRSDEYSGDNGYWFKADYDDGNNWYAFKKITWDRQTWSAWPWDGDANGAFKEWLLKKGTTVDRNGSEQGNMHLWYDYYDDNFSPYKYRTLDDPSPNQQFENQVLMGETQMLKGDELGKILEKREVKREITDPTHVVEKTKRDYYYSMNILNGDGGFVDREHNKIKNKTLYYNEYELKDIRSFEEKSENAGKSYIPIKIRIVTSCKIKDITVEIQGHNKIVYSFEKDITNDDLSFEASGKDGGVPTSKKLKLERKAGTYNETTGEPIDENGDPFETGGHEPKYTFEGSIYDLDFGKYATYDSASDTYTGKRNTKVTVKMNVYLPNGKVCDKPAEDTITVVRRDFFMLD
ncbi:MAG: hypothetical protein K6E49_07000 [Lachnospiraceae bacterium]|nr:hypothetical protein [Lachnospiraceae bacterium]